MSTYTEYITTKHYEINYHYLHRYIKFIDHHLANKNSDDSVVHIHHILPKALFEEFSALSTHKWNAINLTFRQHRVAHILLAYAFPKTNMRCALRFFYVDKISGTNWYNDGENNYRLPKGLSNGLFVGRLSTDIWKNRTYVSKDGKNKQIHINELEEYLKNGYKKYLIKEPITLLTDGSVNIGIKQTELSQFMLAYPEFTIGYIVRSDRRRKGASVIFHKEDLECRVMDFEKDKFIKNGWLIGRSPKTKQNCKHAANQINKDGVNKRVSNDELQFYLNSGWKLGLPANDKHNIHLIGSKAINKDGINKRVNISCLELYLNDGWSLGADRTNFKKCDKNNIGKTYKICDPTGNIIIIRNLRKFLIDNNLSNKAFKNTGVPYKLKYNDSRSSIAAKNSEGWYLVEVLSKKQETD